MTSETWETWQRMYIIPIALGALYSLGCIESFKQQAERLDRMQRSNEITLEENLRRYESAQWQGIYGCIQGGAGALAGVGIITLAQLIAVHNSNRKPSRNIPTYFK